MDKVRVMIVDDNFRFATATEEFLSAHEALEVLAVAASGEEALQRLEAEHPDLVLTDAFMPEMSGFELSRRLRRRNPGQQILIVSLDSDPTLADLARLSGAQHFLAKGRLATDLLPYIEQRFGLRASGSRPAVQELE